MWGLALLTDNVKLSDQFKDAICPSEAPVGQTAFDKALKNNFAQYVPCKFSIELLELWNFHIYNQNYKTYLSKLWHSMEWIEGTAVIG